MNTDPSPETKIFDNSHEALVELFELHPKGAIFVCPVCSAKLIVALTKEESREKQVHTGIYCPNDASHVSRMFNMSGDREG